MNSTLKPFLLILLVLLLFSCNQKVETLAPQNDDRKKIEMTTNYGTMVIELYNETPLHRDNFANLAKNGAYDSLLFHRVINQFMIQGGDPESKKAKPGERLGSGDAPYKVNAEINKELFHKKGVLAAARDQNPAKASSAMQFYIVQGKIHNDSLLDRAEIYTNQNKAREYYRNSPEKKPLLDSIQNAFNNRNRERYNTLIDSILDMAKQEEDFEQYVMPEKFRKIYKAIGGYPRLDQNYTVFGEVIEGLNVIDSIAAVKTNENDRPLNDVRILSVTVLE